MFVYTNSSSKTDCEYKQEKKEKIGSLKNRWVHRLGALSVAGEIVEMILVFYEVILAVIKARCITNHCLACFLLESQPLFWERHTGFWSCRTCCIVFRHRLASCRTVCLPARDFPTHLRQTFLELSDCPRRGTPHKYRTHHCYAVEQVSAAAEAVTSSSTHNTQFDLITAEYLLVIKLSPPIWDTSKNHPVARKSFYYQSHSLNFSASPHESPWKVWPSPIKFSLRTKTNVRKKIISKLKRRERKIDVGRNWTVGIAVVCLVTL